VSRAARNGSGAGIAGTFTSAGERVGLRCESRAVARELAGALDGELVRDDASSATLSVLISDDRTPFPTAGFNHVARGMWRRDHEAVAENVCSSGFDLRVRVGGDAPEFTFRRRPSVSVRAAAWALPARARQLTRLTLLTYPAMWAAAARGRVPLHVASFRAPEMSVVVGGPSGVGKSTAVHLEVASGARALSDNLCVTDGATVWPVAEPVRLAGGSGPKAPHGRSEAPFRGRLAEVTPDVIVLLRRGATGVRALDPSTAGRELAAITYMAGELRRFWSFAASLAAATEVGPSHPPVDTIASTLAQGVPCVEVARSAPDDAPISVLLRRAGVASRGGAA
jgi:hypothetical protein